MLDPAIGKLIRKYESRYQLVSDVSRLARKLSADAERERRVLVEKPVGLATDELWEMRRNSPRISGPRGEEQ